MLEILDEVSQKIGVQLETAWLLNGEPIRSPLELPIECRIIVASKSEDFQGIGNYQQFDRKLVAAQN